MKLFITLLSAFSFSFASQTELMTLEKWKTLSEDDRAFYIEGYDLEKYSNLKVVDLITQEANPAALEFGATMEKFMDENMSTEIEDEHSRVGDTRIFAHSVLMMDETPLGGTIGYFQDGCDLEEDNWQYFETEDEAKAAGCDTEADVSWQGHGTFDYDGSALSYDSYMGWSGY